jgi:hypothetical protein
MASGASSEHLDPTQALASSDYFVQKEHSKCQEKDTASRLYLLLTFFR